MTREKFSNPSAVKKAKKFNFNTKVTVTDDFYGQIHMAERFHHTGTMARFLFDYLISMIMGNFINANAHGGVIELCLAQVQAYVKSVLGVMPSNGLMQKIIRSLRTVGAIREVDSGFSISHTRADGTVDTYSRGNCYLIGDIDPAWIEGVPTLSADEDKEMIVFKSLHEKDEQYKTPYTENLLNSEDESLKQMAVETLEAAHWMQDSLKRSTATKLGANHTKVQRVFSGSASWGGRYYTPFQQLSSETRDQVLLDGSPVVSIDFKCSQPAILDIIWNGKDALCHKDFDYYGTVAAATDITRKEAKVAINIILNAQDPKMALTSENVRRDADKVWLSPEKYARLQDAIEQHIPFMAHVAGSSIGVSLQKIEGDIATAMSIWCKARNIPMINVHDEYLVPVQHAAEFEEELYKTRDVICADISLDHLVLSAHGYVGAKKAFRKAVKEYRQEFDLPENAPVSMPMIRATRDEKWYDTNLRKYEAMFYHQRNRITNHDLVVFYKANRKRLKVLLQKLDCYAEVAQFVISQGMIPVGKQYGENYFFNKLKDCVVT